LAVYGEVTWLYAEFYVVILGIKVALTQSRKNFDMLTNMIDYLRYALYLVLIIITMVLYQAWDTEHPAAPVQNAIQPGQATPANDYVPTVSDTSKATVAAPIAAKTSHPETSVISTAPIVHVKTDVFDVDIDTQGGNITQVKLLQYPQDMNSKTPFLLLNNTPDARYLAQSGLLSEEGPDTSKGQAIYTTEKTDYTLEQSQDQLQVKLAWHDKKGVQITKIFTFKPDNYEIGVAYQIENKSPEVWEGNMYLQLLRKNAPPENSKGLISLATYFGAAVASPEKPFNKISFKQMQDNAFSQNITGGWAAMIQHYFVSAWVPDKNSTSQYFSKVTADGLYAIGMVGPKLSIAPNATVDTQAKFYAGPSIADKLEKVAPGLQLTIDYGWFWFISIAIFWMMQKIHSFVGNWGWSIVLVTLVIKLLFYKLSAKSYRSMSVLKKLQPKINELKTRFGEDKQKFTQATLELYKKEKVNPMSGCLPILIQIPVFIALYWVLIESVQLRQAPFILWIHDLTQKDPFYVLPVLMGLSMFFQQRLNPPPADPIQAKVMMFMPIVFIAMFLNFPAGLMLYWFVNNSLSFLQQWYIMRSISDVKPAVSHSKKRK
jgi:YidC/Oxa1 family membrane protein insertase